MGLQALKHDLLRPKKMREAPTIPSSRQNVSTLKQMTLCTSSTCLCANLFSQSLDDDYIFPQFFFFLNTGTKGKYGKLPKERVKFEMATALQKTALAKLHTPIMTAVSNYCTKL